MPASTEIVNRKLSHFDLCANQDVEFRRKTTLFEDVDLVHQPLVETRLEDIDLSVVALGKRLRCPLIITGMTGGAEEVARFNRDVAALADRMGVGFGVGSQRVALRHPEMKKTFQVRDVAPNVLLFGNIGVAQARELTSREVTRLAEDIEADAMCVHLNAAMEIIQENGDHDFRGSLDAVKRLVGESKLPIIVKETGCGFARESGMKLAAPESNGLTFRAREGLRGSGSKRYAIARCDILARPSGTGACRPPPASVSFVRSV